MRKTRSTRNSKNKFHWNKVQRFSIRKFSFGVASCMIGAQFVLSGLPNTVEAAFKQLNGEDGIVSLYSNSGETPESANGIEIGSKVNVDKEIGIDVDWSQYTRENPIVKVTYTYNGGADGSSVTGFGGHRPRFWFTTPIGLKEPKEITLKKNDGRPVYVMKTWEGKQKFTSLSNSVNSRFQTKDDINRAYREIDFHGDDTKWESYNDTTGESHREYSGSFANKFWYHIGDRISDDPYEQAIYESFRTNTKTMYVDWERGGIERATITAVYEVADPTFGNDRSTLEFGAGFRVGIARMMQHYKTVLTPVPSLYKLNEIFEPSTPTRATVGNPNKLTEKEKNIVRDRIWNANKDNVTSVARTGKNKLIENLKSEDKTESILIDDDGTATIIYSDNSRDVIPGTSLVYKVTETNTHRQGDGYEYDIAPVPVKNMDQITEEEKKAAIKSFLKANGIGVENLKYHSGKSDLDFEGGILQDDKGNKWFAYDDNTANAKNIGTHIGFKPNSSTVMLSRDAGYSGVYTIPTSDLYYKEGTSALDLAKKDAEAAIDNLNYLSPKEKQAFKEKLKDKTTQESVNAVVEEAVAKNSENEKALEAKKREVKEKINNNPYLTTAEKKELVDQVSAVVMTDPTEGTATPIEHTKGLVDKILDKALEKTKEKAKAIIDEIDKNGGQAGYLEKPTAAQYKEQIQNATTQEAIAKVIEDALNQKSKKAHDAEKAKTDALKDEYKKKIDQVPGLTDAQRDEYKKQIDAATTRDQLEAIVKDAEVKAYRDTAKAKIDALEHLNAAQKAELKTQVDAAGSKAEVDNIVSIAQGLDSKMDSLQKLVAEAEKVKASDKYTNPNVSQDKKTTFDTAKDAASKVADKTTAEPENAAGTSEVAALIDNLAKAIEALTGEKVPVPVSKDALKAEIDLNTDDAVKKSPAYAKETDATKKKAYDDALAKAKEVYAKQNATQTDVDNALDTLKQARLALSGKAEDFTLGVKDGAAKISIEPKAGATLTEKADKDAVKAKVTVNGNALDDTYSVEYGAIAEKGDKKVVPVTVTHDGITRTVDVPVEGTDAAKSPLNDPEKVKVNNVNNLSEDEKAAVKAAVKKANTNLIDNQISVDNTGKVTVTYSDKSQNELPASKTVEAKTEAEKALDAAKEKAKADLTAAANKEKEEIEADKNLTDQQKADKKAEVDKVKKAQEANIDKAQTTDEVAKATEAGKKAIDAVHQTELDKAKEKAKADLTEAANKEKEEIEADKNLTDQQKADKKAEVDKVKKEQEANIDKAQTTDEVAKATEDGKKAIDKVHQTDLEKAKDKAKADLTKAAEEEKKEIDADNGLTKSEKEALKQKVDEVKKAQEANIDKANTPEEVASATTNGKQAIAGVHTPTDIKEYSKELNKPENKVKVTDTNHLTDEEKSKVKEEVVKANPGLSKDDITVDDKGNVTTPKGFLLPKDVITQALNKPATPVVVADPNHLTDEEKEAVKKAVADANPGLNKDDITVDDKGNVTTKNGDKLLAKDVVTPALKKPTTPVVVENPASLTDKEKENIKDAVVAENPGLNKGDVEVDNQGNVETPKGNLPKEDVVTTPLNKPNKLVEVENPNSLTVKEKEAVKEAVVNANPGLDKKDIKVDDQGNVTTPKGNLSAKGVVTSTLKKPTTPVEVVNPAKLTDQEKAKVVEEIIKNNPGLTDKDIKVDDQGNVETPKGNLPSEDVVTPALKKPTKPVEVKDPNNLTDKEKEDVKKAVIEANKDANGQPTLNGDQITVNNDGSVTTPKGNLQSGDVVTPALKKPTKPVEVKDPNNLTDKEKEAVKKAVIEANKDANGQPTLNGDQVTVNNDGSVTTPKGNLPSEDVVTPALKKPTTPVEVKDPNNLTNKEKEAVKKAVIEANKDANGQPTLSGDQVTVNNDGSVITPKGNLPAKDVVKTKVETAKGAALKFDIPELSYQDAVVAGVVAVEKGKELTDKDILTQLALGEGAVTAKVISKPTTTETGTKEAEVEVTLADGRKVTVKVPVVVYEGERPEVNDLAKAKEDAKKQVEEAAKTKIAEINNNKELTAEQKQKAEDAINKAKEAADKAIDEATSAGTAKAIGDEAAKNIAEFKPEQDSVKPVDPSKLDEEKAKAIAEIEQAAKDQTDAIKNNAGLTQEQKDKAIKEIEDLKAKAIENVRKATTKEEVAKVVNDVETAIKNVDPQPIPTPQPQPQPQPGNNGGNGSNQNAQANSDAVEYAKQAAKNILEEAARAKKAQLEEAGLSDAEKEELFAKVDAEKQAALDEIAKAKDVDTVKQLVTKAVAKIKAIQPARNAQDNQDSQDAQNTQSAQDAQNHSNSNPTSLDAANVRGQELPATGTGSEFVVFNAAAISILTGLGLAIPSKKKEIEK